MKMSNMLNQNLRKKECGGYKIKDIMAEIPLQNL